MSLKQTFIGIILILAVSLIGFLPFIQSLNFRAMDFFRTGHNPHLDIVILAIDNKSLQEIGRWPWPRKIHAALLRQLNFYSPRTVALDINFAEAENLESDTELTKALDEAKFPIVLPIEILSFQEKKSLLWPLKYFREAKNVSLGYVNVPDSTDGLARIFPTELNINDQTVMPFAFQIFKSIGGFPAIQLSSYPALQPSSWLDFVGPAGSFPTYSLSDFLNGQISQEKIKDKIVLIGATASDLHDVVPVPLKNSLMSGIEWHANVLDNLLFNRQITVLDSKWPWLIGVLISALLLIISSKTTLKKSLLAALILIAILPTTSFVLFKNGFVFVYFYGAVLATGTFLIQGLYRWYAAEIERRRLRRAIQNYFSAPVLEMVMNNPAMLKLGGERREITILFSDIRSFTTITETTSPEILSAILHEYFTEMTEEILATDGVVDKFIGDAIMAFWGAPLDQPDHADRAVKSAIGMIKRLEKLQAKWLAKGWPHVDIGIGINSGMATVGNMGSEKRFDYTVIGDSVNAAARLEGLNKEYHSHIIISDETRRRLKSVEGDFKELGEVKVKGKNEALKIYQICLPEDEHMRTG